MLRRQSTHILPVRLTTVHASDPRTDHICPEEQGRDVGQLNERVEQFLCLQLVSRRQYGTQHLPKEEATESRDYFQIRCVYSRG